MKTVLRVFLWPVALVGLLLGSGVSAEAQQLSLSRHEATVLVEPMRRTWFE